MKRAHNMIDQDQLGMVLDTAMIKLFTRIFDRIDQGRSDSDTLFFNYLMYGCELLTKLAVLGMAASIRGDRDRLRYSQFHRLVRADGIGEWASILEDILSGPSAQYLIEDILIEQKELMQKHNVGIWQHECVNLMHRCVKIVDSTVDDLPVKVEAKRWMILFARLRNKTRGHGAPRQELISELCEPLEKSMRLFYSNFNLFKREWAYIHRNLSGKYRITQLSSTTPNFDKLKSQTNETLPDGVYFFAGKYIYVELAFSDLDGTDFFVSNGGFTEKKYEVLSYISGETKLYDSGPYTRPTGSLPDSETHALGTLDVRGACFSNLPSISADYVKRQELETELDQVLLDDHHPIISLTGRGGIGKTSLALAVLNNKICQTARFDNILWFSARDIDLLPTGPKPVRPHILTINDVAREFVKLLNPLEAKEKGFRAEEYLSNHLSKTPAGNTCFVFDNFETVSDPIEFYKWLDAHIRVPNKCLITSRNRYFKGDYPIDVGGMTEVECKQLIDSVSKKLGIRGILTEDYTQSLMRESDGHPYVIKILLGEVAKTKTLRNIQRIVADKESILLALFERTYVNLTPVAQRVFLTLCGWHSTVPQLALEAVLLQARNDRMDVSVAVEELHRSSFIELIESEHDRELFISVPLVAAAFGRPKLTVSPYRSAIEADLSILRQFGAAQPTDARHGIGPRIERIIQYISREISQRHISINEYYPMLEFLARRYPGTWFYVAELFLTEGNGSDASFERAKEAIRHFLEAEVSSGNKTWKAWKLLSVICKETKDCSGECHALAEMAECSETPFYEISNAAARFAELLFTSQWSLEHGEKDVIFRRLSAAMDIRISEGDATARSRLAWLYLHRHEESVAKTHVLAGLILEPNNEHCLRLAERLNISRSPSQPMIKRFTD